MEFTVTQLLIDPPPDLWYVLLREPHGFFQRKSPTVLKIKAKEDNWVIMKTKKIRQKKTKTCYLQDKKPAVIFIHLLRDSL